MSIKIPKQWKEGRLIPVMDTDPVEFPNERWKYIPEFEGYQISDYGRVKVLARIAEDKNGKIIHRKEQILRIRTMRIEKNVNEMLVQTTIHREGKSYSFAVSRLVYCMFVAPFDIADRSLSVKKRDNDYLNCYYKNLRLEFSGRPNKQVRNISKGIKKMVMPLPNDAAIVNKDIKDLPNEEWKFIPEFGDIYQLSNYGRVKSIARVVYYSDGRIVNKKARIHQLRISPYGSNKSQYTIYTTLMKDDTAYVLSVPRHVYALFVAAFDMDNISVIITKKDGNDLNCYYTNLELTTITDHKNKLIAEKGPENAVGPVKPVNQYDATGKFIKRYASIAKASEATGIDMKLIKNAIYRKQLQDKKFYWQGGDQREMIDLSDYKSKELKYRNKVQTPVQKLALDGTLLETYPSLSAATKAMGFKSNTTIGRACKDIRFIGMGYRWRLVETKQSSESPGKKKKPYKQRPVNQYSQDGVFIRRYDTAGQAGREITIETSAIRTAAYTKYRTAKGCYWRFGKAQPQIDVSAYATQRENHLLSKKRPVQQYTLSSEPLEIFASISDAAKAVKGQSSAIRTSCQNESTCKGYRWKFVD